MESYVVRFYLIVIQSLKIHV